MVITNSVFTLFLITIIFSISTIANDITVYRWLDDNNVMHFSQHQPQEGKFSQLTTIASYKAKQQSLTNKTTYSVDNKEEEAQKVQTDTMAKNKEIFANNCKAAQFNIKMLNSLNQILITDANGNNHTLTDEEKKDKLESSQKQVKTFCLNKT